MSNGDDSKPTIPQVWPWVKLYLGLEGNEVGGSLHIVLSDRNLERSHCEFCRDFALERGDYAGAALASILMRMSLTQRRKLNRLAVKRLYGRGDEVV